MHPAFPRPETAGNPGPDRGPRTAAVVAGMLLVANLAGNLVVPSWAYVPFNLAVAGVLVWVAVSVGGATAGDLGMGPASMGRGIRLGAVPALVAAAVIVVLAAIPWTRPFFEDDRAAGIGASGLLYQTLIRIPLGTALYEEVAFRGVVYGLGRRAWGVRPAAAVSAALFGLWHVLPALRAAAANRGVGDVKGAAVVAVSVTATAVAGLVFVWIRERAGSLVAPVMVHIATNSTAFAAAWVVLGSG